MSDEARAYGGTLLVERGRIQWTQRRDLLREAHYRFEEEAVRGGRDDDSWRDGETALGQPRQARTFSAGERRLHRAGIAELEKHGASHLVHRVVPSYSA